MSILAATRNFEDAAPHVSKLLFRPLATKEETDRYQKAKDDLTAKQNEADDFQDQQVENIFGSCVPRTADYMIARAGSIATRRMRRRSAGKRDCAAEVLEKWAAFLEPTAEARPYLDEWTAADDDSLAAVGAGVSEAYRGRLRVRRPRSRSGCGVCADAARICPTPRREGPDKFFNEVYYRGPLVVVGRGARGHFVARRAPKN